MEAVQKDPAVPVDWIGLLLAYRRGPKDVIGSELVAQLELYIRAVAQGFDAVPPTIEAADIHQQLVIEVLIAAERLPLPAHPEWVPRQLMLRASRQVARWLAREKAQAALPLGESLRLESAPVIGEAFSGTTGIGINDEDLTLLHRFHVLGESGRELAEELGISVPALWRRVSRAASRCRVSVAARTRDGHKGRRGTHKGRLGVSSFAHPDGQLRKDGARTTEIPGHRRQPAGQEGGSMTVRRRRPMLATLVLLFGATLLAAGCGQSSGSAARPSPSPTPITCDGIYQALGLRPSGHHRLRPARPMRGAEPAGVGRDFRARSLSGTCRTGQSESAAGPGWGRPSQPSGSRSMCWLPASRTSWCSGRLAPTGASRARPRQTSQMRWPSGPPAS